MILTVINYIFTDLMQPIWDLITSSWILTAYLLMSVIGVLFTWVFPRDNDE